MLYLDQLHIKKNVPLNDFALLLNRVSNFLITPATYLLNGRQVSYVNGITVDPKNSHSNRLPLLKTTLAIISFIPGLISATALRYLAVFFDKNLSLYYKKVTDRTFHNTSSLRPTSIPLVEDPTLLLRTGTKKEASKINSKETQLSEISCNLRAQRIAELEEEIKKEKQDSLDTALRKFEEYYQNHLHLLEKREVLVAFTTSRLGSAKVNELNTCFLRLVKSLLQDDMDSESLESQLKIIEDKIPNLTQLIFNFCNEMFLEEQQKWLNSSDLITHFFDKKTLKDKTYRSELENKIDSNEKLLCRSFVFVNNFDLVEDLKNNFKKELLPLKPEFNAHLRLAYPTVFIKLFFKALIEIQEIAFFDSCFSKDSELWFVAL